MERQEITVPEHTPGLPFSDAVVAGGMVYLSGQVGWDPITRQADPSIAVQTERCLENVKHVLQAAGSSMDRVVKVTVYLRNAGDFAAMNDVYRRYFSSKPPARTTVAAELAAANLLIEIDVIALA